jgi:hypothetical protein
MRSDLENTFKTAATRVMFGTRARSPLSSSISSVSMVAKRTISCLLLMVALAARSSHAASACSFVVGQSTYDLSDLTQAAGGTDYKISANSIGAFDARAMRADEETNHCAIFHLHCHMLIHASMLGFGALAPVFETFNILPYHIFAPRLLL